MAGRTPAWRIQGRTAAAVVLLLAVLGSPAPVRAQDGAPPATVMELLTTTTRESDTPPQTTAMDLLTPVGATSTTHLDEDVIQAGCASCGNGGGALKMPPVGEGLGLGAGCSTCGGGRGPCVPNKKPCCPCDANTWLGRFGCCIYECICCPDPCYEPRWTPISDAAFFVESARPITQQRLRWEQGIGVQFPDRSEFFWARENVTFVNGTPPSVGKGPFIPVLVAPRPGQVPPVRQLYVGEIKLNYSDLSLYTEVATNFVSFFVELPYRSIDAELVPHAAGFGDMNLGTKSLLYDCELLQLTFQFKTYILTGNFLKGLGNGHMTIEPSVILNVKCGPDSYVQSQIAEWIPLGGDPQYAGAILRYNLSYNHVLCRPVGDSPLIGTWEFSGYSFQDGAYTDPISGPYQKASGYTYASTGPGLRWVFCDKIDFGVGTEFSVNTHHFGSPVIRSEIRWRF